MASIAHYPGSDERSTRALALPYVIYRGDIFRLGEDGIARGIFFDSDRLELDLSFAAAFDLNSGDSSSRQGMPDLDYMGELGPNLKIKLGDWDGKSLVLDLPIRAVFSSDFSNLNQRGYKFNPKLTYTIFRAFGTKTKLNLSLASTFATEKTHDYFYEVDQRYATPNRAEFNAKGGYLGSTLAVGFSVGITDNLRIFYGAQAHFFDGARNSDSPLHRSDFNYTVGAGLVWSFWKSDRKVSSTH